MGWLFLAVEYSHGAGNFIRFWLAGLYMTSWWLYLIDLKCICIWKCRVLYKLYWWYFRVGTRPFLVEFYSLFML